MNEQPKYNRAREMADEVMAELEACSNGWNDEDVDRIQGTLLPRVYDCLNLLAMVIQGPGFEPSKYWVIRDSDLGTEYVFQGGRPTPADFMCPEAFATKEFEQLYRRPPPPLETE